jgi:undecaprenyl-diphosphatase
MISSQFVVISNTHGVFFLIAFVLLYEVLIVRKKEVALHAAFSTLAALVFSVILKELFLMPRPYLAEGGYPEAGLTSFSSLPSVHAAIAFCLATSVTLHQRKLGIFLFTMAVAISFGRVLANVHYPIDIIVGMLIGVLTGIIFNQIHIRVSKG